MQETSSQYTKVRQHVADLLQANLFTNQSGIETVRASTAVTAYIMSLLTPPPEAQGKPIARWVKASDRLPKYLGDPQIHYRLDGFHKVLGNFYNKEDGEVVFGVIGVTHKDYDIRKDKWSGLEWLEEITTPSSPDFTTALQSYLADVRETKGGFIHQAETVIADLSVYLKSSTAAVGDWPWAAGVTDHEKESALIEYLGSNPNPASVSSDFTTALEAEVETRFSDPESEYAQDFENGAEWARKYLANLEPVDGKWKYDCMVSPPPPESGCVNTVTQWITDGKIRIEIDDFDADLLDNGEVQLSSFLNKYRYKLSIDDHSPLIISHLDLQSQQAGPRWVRADRLDPKPGGLHFYKFDNKLDFKSEGRGFFTENSFDGDEDEFPENEYPFLWILDDSPAPEQVDPVAFVEWVQDEWYEWNQHMRVWVTTRTDIPQSIKTAELLSKYTASLQNKQP